MLNFGPDTMLGSTVLGCKHLWFLLVKHLFNAVIFVEKYSLQICDVSSCFIDLCGTNCVWDI